MVGAVFADAGTGEERPAVDVVGLGGLCGALVLLPLRLPIGVAGILLLGVWVALFYLDGETLTRHPLAVDIATGTTYVEGALHVGLDDVGESGGDGTGDLSVDDLGAGHVRGVGSRKHRETFEIGSTEVVGTSVDLIADFKSLSHIDTSGGTHGELLCRCGER